jgi:hypothetical protein
MKYTIDDGTGAEKIVSFDSATTVLYNEAEKEYKDAVSSFTLADNTLKAAKNYQDAFIKKYNVDGGVDRIRKETAKIKVLEKAEATERDTRLVSKSGCVIQTSAGAAWEIGRILLGANLSIGTDTTKTKVKSASVRSPYHAALLMNVGYPFTDRLELYVALGVRVNAYTIKSGRRIVMMHKSLIQKVKDLDEFRATKITEAEKAIVEAKDDEIAKATAEAQKKMCMNIPVIGALEATKSIEAKAREMEKCKKTKAGLVFGPVIKYRFTKGIKGVLVIEVQPRRKILDNDNIRVEDKSLTIKCGVEFNI